MNELTCIEHDKIYEDNDKEIHVCTWCKLVSEHCNETVDAHMGKGRPPWFHVTLNTASYTKALANARGPNGHAKHAKDTHREFLDHETYYRRPVIQWEAETLARKCLDQATACDEEVAKQLRDEVRGHIETMRTMADGDSRAARKVRDSIETLEAELAKPPPPKLPERTVEAWTAEALVPIIKSATDDTPAEKLPRLKIISIRNCINSSQPSKFKVRVTPRDMAPTVAAPLKAYDIGLEKMTDGEKRRYSDDKRERTRQKELEQNEKLIEQHEQTGMCKRARIYGPDPMPPNWKPNGPSVSIYSRKRHYYPPRFTPCDGCSQLHGTRSRLKNDRYHRTGDDEILPCGPFGVKLNLKVACPLAVNVVVPAHVLLESKRAEFRKLEWKHI